LQELAEPYVRLTGGWIVMLLEELGIRAQRSRAVGRSRRSLPQGLQRLIGIAAAFEAPSRGCRILAGCPGGRKYQTYGQPSSTLRPVRPEMHHFSFTPRVVYGF
jgi:hypothetical protein